MKWIRIVATTWLAWLIGYYYEQCPVCGCGVAYLNNGRIVTWCSRAAHERDDR